MKAVSAFLAGLLLAVSMAYAGGSGVLPSRKASAGGPLDEINPRSLDIGGRADTTWFGDYRLVDGLYYARSAVNGKAGVMWTFDRGNGPTNDPNVIYNGEGWKGADLTSCEGLYWRPIGSSLFLGEGVPPPIIHGSGSLWIGVDKHQADSLCYACGAGYGNGWRQRVVSPPLAYNGSGNVVITLKYFSATEDCYDGTQIYLKRTDNSELLLNVTPPGGCIANPLWERTGGFTGPIGSFTSPATFNRTITQDEIGSAQAIRFVIEFISDAGYSDEDGAFCTTEGPFCADDCRITGGGVDATYGWDSGFQGWTPSCCAPVGLFVSVVDVGCYTILDPCACGLAGNALTMHACLCDDGTHPDGQHIQVESPICDISEPAGLKRVFMEFDLYAELPRENGVLIRPGWKYYPWQCDVTGLVGWSPRIGQEAYDYFGQDPICSRWRYSGTEVNGGASIPPDAQKVIAVIELLASCSAFAITDCSGITNATPLFDNIAIGVIGPNSPCPYVVVENGAYFQDHGSYPSDRFDPRGPSPADVSLDKYFDQTNKPDVGGDSLTIVGPTPGPDPNQRWEARMWWRIAHRAPLNSDEVNGAVTRYKIWKDAVSDGRAIDRPDRPEFCYGWMDSVQNGGTTYRNRFLSCFREDDDDFAGEGTPENEMIWDDVLFPGSRVEYFITSNLVRYPNASCYLPDTTGGFFFEFEILPGVRVANVANCSGAGFDYCVYHPATLYIDASNRGEQPFIECALRTILNGYAPCQDVMDCVIPKDRNWDRYDYQNAASNYNVPFGRGSIAGSNNGMTLLQIIGYRAILVNTGSLGAGTMEPRDWALFREWLYSPECNANLSRQFFKLNGDKPGSILDATPEGQQFMVEMLGATLLCDSFNGVSDDPDCLPEEQAYCIRWMPEPGGPIPATEDIDAFGNWCPQSYGFNVFNPVGEGVSSRYYLADGGTGKDMHSAEVVRCDLRPSANFCVSIEGVSWPHMTLRSPGEDHCPRDDGSVCGAIIADLGATMKWGFGVTSYAGIPKLVDIRNLTNCQGVWCCPTDAEQETGAALVDRLYPNVPNPFNPRTLIKFSLAQNGPVRVVIYDVNGRRVKTLVDGRREAGVYTETWDGTNDSGRRVGSGVYWTQMKAGAFLSNNRMVVLK
jgi:hypothetical protein